MLRAFKDSPDVKVYGKQVQGHGVTLKDIPEENTAIVSLRDPVRRFRSGYDMNHRDNHRDIRRRYPTASEFALALPEIMYDEEWGYTYRPQILWTGGAEEMKRRGVLWVVTEDIDRFILALDVRNKSVHRVHWNSQDHFGLPRSKLSPIAIGAIYDAYAADMRMMKMLGVPDEYFTPYEGRS